MAQLVKNCLPCRRCGFDPWVGKIPWRRKCQPTPVFLPGKSHGQRCLAGYSLCIHRVGHYLETKPPLQDNKFLSQRNFRQCEPCFPSVLPESGDWMWIAPLRITAYFPRHIPGLEHPLPKCFFFFFLPALSSRSVLCSRIWHLAHRQACVTSLQIMPPSSTTSLDLLIPWYRRVKGSHFLSIELPFNSLSENSLSPK